MLLCLLKIAFSRALVLHLFRAMVVADSEWYLIATWLTIASETVSCRCSSQVLQSDLCMLDATHLPLLLELLAPLIRVRRHLRSARLSREMSLPWRRNVSSITMDLRCTHNQRSGARVAGSWYNKTKSLLRECFSDTHNQWNSEPDVGNFALQSKYKKYAGKIALFLYAVKF